MHARILLAFLTVLTLAGCEPVASSPIPRGTRVTDAQLCAFRAGRTTPEEVRAALGDPTASLSTGDLDLTLMYLYQEGTTLIEQVSFAFRDRVLETVQRSHVGSPAGPLPACLGLSP